MKHKALEEWLIVPDLMYIYIIDWTFDLDEFRCPWTTGH